MKKRKAKKKNIQKEYMSSSRSHISPLFIKKKIPQILKGTKMSMLFYSLVQQLV
jgi:hypothetical protein